MQDPDGDASHGQTVAHAARRSDLVHVRAYVGLGSNLGDAAGTLAAAVAALGALPGVRIRGVSDLYATAPVGVLDQPEFRNAVVALDVPSGPDRAASALALLVALKDLERAFGRQVRQRWGPRELDLDLLVFGRWAGSTERSPEARSADPAKRDMPLTVPHPQARERLFVLTPLSDLAPRLVPPGWGETVARAAARRRTIDGPDAVRRIGVWTPAGWRTTEPAAAQPSERIGSATSRTSPSTTSTR
jgi:2-amino-4-hydroxy-6-hydroxymethyldihydropteridine diphosphokinase